MLSKVHLSNLQILKLTPTENDFGDLIRMPAHSSEIGSFSGDFFFPSVDINPKNNWLPEILPFLISLLKKKTKGISKVISREQS